MITPISPDLIEFNQEVQGYCKLPYPRHKDGCPNWGKKNNMKGIKKDLKDRVINDCPPGIPLINKIFDFSKEMYIIYHEFELGENAERIFQNGKHRKPEHCYNLRYWQEKAQSVLRSEAELFLDLNPDTIVDLSPEAHGVNLDITMKNMGISIPWYKPWPPKEHTLDNITSRIALAGYPYNPKE